LLKLIIDTEVLQLIDYYLSTFQEIKIGTIICLRSQTYKYSNFVNLDISTGIFPVS